MNHPDPETAADPATRIAMWSGPRTVSTALMRAWENRPDTVVADEPLYAFYLDRTGLDHPGRDEVIASQPTDWRVVLARLTSAPLPAGAVIGYAKHMTHHLLPEVDRAALAPFRHAHLIRDPRELLASYARVRTEPTLADLGLAQQAEIFESVRRPGRRFPRPARRSRGHPARALPGSRRPLRPPGCWPGPPAPATPTAFWAPYWYASVQLLDRLHALPPADQPAPRPPRTPRGKVHAVLLAPARLPHHQPGWRILSEPKGRRCRLD